MLNLSQIAALQQMGICVWQQVGQDVATDSAMPVTTQPSASRVQTAPDRTQQLAALRTAISRDNPDSKDTTSSQAVAATAEPAEAALTAEQQSQAEALLDDISLAMAVVLPNQPMPAVKIASELKVTSQQISLPVAPAALTAADKKQLWQAMVWLG
ncbi:hypothetical protein IT774_11935 [Salinimonas marina]|uniref:Uncharacterized protein n=1 Tax=Salinimonas marina TaxID=2785918 RepID=A0A7S9DVT1_9ALTE|nr:hypothetical protein [Salinimonas marina]QPG04872.1 hypothetical protein IT774_11935 [Salinimonas marina]